MKHPLHLFRFCPRCGSAHFSEHDERAKVCAECGFVYYHNAACSTAAVIVNEKNELLVARRAKEPEKGTLDLPGGFVDPDESATEGVLREVWEETGARGKVERFLFSLPNRYVYSGMTIHTCDLFFQVSLPSDADLKASDDAAALFWLPLSGLNPADFGLHSIRTAVERLLEEIQKL